MVRHVWLLAIAVSMPGTAQEGLSLESAVLRALQSHPLLAAQSERVASAYGLVQQARLRPNPRIYLQSENWSLSGADPLSASLNSDQFAYFTQPIETGGKRQRRVELSNASLQIVGLERELVAKQISSRVKLAYWAAVGAQRVRQLWLEQQENFHQTVQYHEDRVREGALAESELLRVRLEADRFSVEAAAAQLEAERALIALFREMGESAIHPVTLTTALEIVSQSPSADAAVALRERTEVKIARQEVERANASLRLQRSLARPDVEAGFGYKRNLGFNTLLGTVQFNLPIFNKNQGNIQAAVSEEHARRSLLTVEEAQVRAELAAIQKDVESKRHQLQELLAPALRRAAESAEIANAAYREGGADLLRLLDAQRIRIDLEVLYAKTLAEHRQSIVALETALGVN
jgi:cobalt-zinc-cadmium efflux system outer membrane protein